MRAARIRYVSIAALALILALIAFGAFLLRRSHAVPPTSSSPEASSTGLRAITAGSTTLMISGSGHATVNEVPANSGLAAPDYAGSIAFSASISSVARAQIERQAAATRAQIAKDPSDIVQWIALGGLYEAGGDYWHAEKMWMYVTEAWPRDPTAYNNLGDLYLSYLKEYRNAEAEYLALIRLAPDNTNAYRVLFSLYSNDYKQGTGAAEAILKQGIAANPDATDLMVALARYYAARGDAAAAKAQYDGAIAAAERLGNASLAAEIKSEESGQ